jgi:hypothetical protein
MQKTVFVFLFFSVVSVMASEQSKPVEPPKANPCAAWLSLVKAAAAQNRSADQAEMARVVEMAARFGCKPVTGLVKREQVKFYENAGAKVTCNDFYRVLPMVGMAGKEEAKTCEFTKKFVTNTK